MKSEYKIVRMHDHSGGLDEGIAYGNEKIICPIAILSLNLKKDNPIFLHE